MNTILQRTMQDTPTNELMIRGLQDYVSAQEAFLAVTCDVMESVNNLVHISENL
jgi:hypothetical protein